MFIFLLIGLLLQTTPPQPQKTKEKTKIPALILHIKSNDLTYIERIQEEPAGVKYPQRIIVAKDTALIEPLVPGAQRFLFDLKKKRLFVINDSQKAYYEVPLSLLRYRYFMVVERLRRWLEKDRVAVKSITDPAERKKKLSIHKPIWLRLQNFLQNPEPKTVKSEIKEPKRVKKGMVTKKIQILSDGKVVVTTELARTDLVSKEILEAIVGALGLPPKVAKELLKFSGLPLSYQQHLQMGPFHEIRRIEVERITKTQINKQIFVLPKGYKKIGNVPFVLALMEAKRKYGGSSPPIKPSKEKKEPKNTPEKGKK